ncbi:MAG TPA: sulfotransferase [Pseudoxanthomonas sp.]
MTPPNSIESQLGNARRHIASGRLDQARRINATLLSEHPRHTGALIQRSRIESISNNYRLAHAYALQAHEAGAESLRDSTNLLRRLRTFGLIKEMRETIAALSPSALQDGELLNLVAVLFNSINEPERALTFAERGLARDPEAIPLQLSKGQTLMYLGRFAEAEQFLLECLGKRPGLAFAWWMLSRLRKQSAGSNHVTELRLELSEATHPQDTAFIAYALHKELDDLGDIAGAAEALTRACKTMRGITRYSTAETQELFSQLKALPAVDLPPPTPHSDASLTPIFIVGMHRSGTTLMEQFLDGHPDIFCAGELYDFTSQMRYAANHPCSQEIDARIVQASESLDFQAIGKGYLSAVEWRRGHESHITDKLPSNFLNLGFIFRAIPHAKVIHMVRDPIETCFSNLREFFSETTALYSYDQIELADYYREYESLMAHWHERFPGRIIDVAYKDLIQDTEATLRRITAFCGLDLVLGMLDTSARSRSVMTASVVQVRNRPALPEVPKWEPYRNYLDPLIKRLSSAPSAQ